MNLLVIFLLSCSSFMAVTAIWLPGSGSGSNWRLDMYEYCLLANGVNSKELVTRPSSGTAGDPEYTDLNHQWNNCCGYKAPVAYFVVQSVSHVQAGVRCARIAGVRVVPKSGGHSYGKYSFGNNETVVIDLRNLDKIQVNSAEATPSASIGPGALMGQITYGLGTYGSNGGYTIPFGACQVVGMAYGLGGGFSEISRLYGMNVDALLELDLVDAHGSLITASATRSPDLFWALRGGGAGSYGIVTRFKYKLSTAPAAVVQGRQMYAFTEENWNGVFNAWQTMTQAGRGTAGELPDTINAIVRLLPRQANLIELTINEFQLQSGGNTSEVERILATFPSTTLGPPTVRTLPYLNFVMEAGNEETGFNINITDPSQLPQLGRYNFTPSGTLYAKTYYAPRAYPVNNSADLSRIYQSLSIRPADIIIVLRVLGGAIAHPAPTDTAFVHRGQNLYETDVLYIGPAGDASAETTAKRWMNDYYELTRSIINHKESFQNHLDVELPDYLQRYFGENLGRLVRVKDRYDPENVFWNPQSIPTSTMYKPKSGGVGDTLWRLF